MNNLHLSVAEQYLGLVRRVALGVSGVVVIVPAGVLLIDSAGGWWGWLCIAGLAAVCAISVRRGVRSALAWLQFAFSVSLLVLVGMSSGQVSPGALHIIAFGTLVGVVFVFPSGTALAVLGALTMVEAIVLGLNENWAMSHQGWEMPWYLVPLSTLLVGAGFVLAMRSWTTLAHHVDDYENSLRVGGEQELTQRQASAQREATKRRVHETVLSTLTAIAMGAGQGSARDARSACARDLALLDQRLPVVKPDTVQAVVRSAVESASTEVDVTIEVTGEAVLATDAASAIRDAIVESLRNVQRHSGTKSAVIMAEASHERVRIIVRDHGKGMALSSAERFGMRSSLRSGIEAVGGSTRVLSSEEGTTVIFEVPVGFPAWTIGASVRSVTAAGLGGRIGLLGVDAYLLVCLFAAPWPWGTPAAVKLLIAIFVVINVALAFAWQTRARIILAAAVIVSALMALFAMVNQSATCATQSATLAVILPMCGAGLMLAMVAHKGWIWGLLVASAVNIPVVGYVWATGHMCPGNDLTRLLSNLVYLAAVIVTIAIADGILERRRDAEYVQWLQRTDRHAALQAAERAEPLGTIVGPRIRELFTGIADESVSVEAQATRDAAAVLEEDLRAQLSGDPMPSPGFTQFLTRLREAADTCGTEMSFQVFDEWQSGEVFPASVVDRCVDIVKSGRGGQMLVSAMTDEGREQVSILLTGTSPDTGAGGSQAVLCGCEMEVLTDSLEPDAVFISVRRAPLL